MPEATPTTLTQYGMMAEKHWRQFLPTIGQGTGSARETSSDVAEAVEKTEEELSSLRRKLMSQGLTAQQAHDQAWEMVREKYIFLPPEEHLEPPRNEANYRITPINAIGKGSLKRSSKSAARTSLPSACFAHSKRKSAQRPFDHW